MTITPGAHRIFTKTAVEIDGEEKLKMEKDNSFCFMRPKAMVSSSGTSWASENMRLQHENPQMFHVKKGDECLYTGCFQSVVTMIRDKARHFLDSTVENDIKNITAQNGCKFRQYENE